MSYGAMIAEMQGSVAGVDAAFSATVLNEAWGDVRRLGGWSFQQGQTGFAVPGGINAGTVTLQFGSPTVLGDANAIATWLTASQFGSLITQRQFRSGGTNGAGTIYDIVGIVLDPTDPAYGTITLDRPYIDGPNGALQGYTIYQPFIAAPVQDFDRWLAVEDVRNGGTVNVRGNRAEVLRSDPQRTSFGNPGVLLGIGQDSRPNSSTLGWQRYEVWPGPLSEYLYQAWFLRTGVDLARMDDTLPVGIPESLVKARARARLYEWAEANKDPAAIRGAGADYRFLMGEALKQYESELKWARLRDRDRVDIFNTVLHRRRGGPNPATYDSRTGLGRDMVGV